MKKRKGRKRDKNSREKGTKEEKERKWDKNAREKRTNRGIST